MSSEETVAVVICAAGASTRLGGGVKKEYLKIDGDTTVLGSSVQAFSRINSVKFICIAIPKNDEDKARQALSKDFFNPAQKIKLMFIHGGKTRQASVYNALMALAEYNPCYVLIHDGARPWVSTALIQSVMEAAQKYGAAIPLLPFTDTPKEYEGNFITRHLKRANTGIAQTPQGFKYMEILQAHKKAAQESEEFTDDAEVWGRFCGKTAVVPGDPENKKITYKGDIP